MAHTPSYTVEERLAERFELLGRQMGLRADTPQVLRAWQTAVRARLRTLTGIDTMQHCPLEPELGASEQCDGFTRQHVSIAVEPGLRMPIYVLIPDGMQPGERRAAVIAPHGHGGGGKESVAGVRRDPKIAEMLDHYHYDYGVQFARAGLIAFCPDGRGFGERRERTMLPDNDVLGGSCRVINNMAIPLGQTLTGMWTWDLMRLVDYIETRADCDPRRIGCAGLSGGGLQTLWLSALDERIQCAGVSGYFYGYKESLLHLNTNCSCNYVPGLWSLVDIGDIGALIAGRPLIVESGSRDPLNGVPGLENVSSQLAITRKAYAVLGAEDHLTHTVFEGEHRWHGVEIIPWLQRWLVG